MARNSNIEAIILCGGLGTRLKPLFPNVPKTLVKIGNKPFIDILLEKIISHGFRNIVLCTGYLKEQIKDHFSNYRENSNIIFSEEKEPLGTGGALKNAQFLIINDNFLVLNGDSICEIDFNDLEKFHSQKNSLISIVLSNNVLDDGKPCYSQCDSNLQYGFVNIDTQQRIISFNEKSFNKKINAITQQKLINAGIYMMNKKIFDYISNYNTPFSLEYDLFPNLLNSNPTSNSIFGYVTNNKIIDIGTPERYNKALEFLCDDYIKILKEKAKKIRKHVLNMIYEAGSGHIGGSLSCVDILTVLYFHVLNYDSNNPQYPNRDRFILSKGHAAPALYSILAECGYFPVKELKTLRKFGSRLQGHPDAKLLPGIEVSSGSLGQGLSMACGIAISAKLDNKDFKTYVLLGDGELDEGQVWEAMMFASHQKLDNLIVIIDRNNFQIDGPTEKILSLEPFADKWKSFGWDVIELNGHNFKQMIETFQLIKDNKFRGKPAIIIANTIKGKGVSFMEENNSWHGKAPTKEEYELAVKELT